MRPINLIKVGMGTMSGLVNVINTLQNVSNNQLKKYGKVLLLTKSKKL